MIAPRLCNPVVTRVCETCAERGRPNEPVYKLRMCEFCYKGLRHPKATREQLAKERGRERPHMSTSSPSNQ
jgi:hypothetical protein